MRGAPGADLRDGAGSRTPMCATIPPKLENFIPAVGQKLLSNLPASAVSFALLQIASRLAHPKALSLLPLVLF